MTVTAQIIACYGRRYRVRCADCRQYDATTRKKRVDFACGDMVHIVPENSEQVVITDFMPRSSLLYRQDDVRSKLIAANVTQLFVVTAAVPLPGVQLLQRALLAAEAAGIRPVIVFNKAELPEAPNALQRLAPFADMGYPVLPVSALGDITSLRRRLQGERNIFLGQSGVGKSTLTNALLGEAVARVGSLSAGAESGKHTTTHARLYDLDDTTQLIDSPGLQTFGLHHLQPEKLLRYFPDMRGLVGQCRFHNCKHLEEPDCAVKEAVQSGTVSADRLDFLQGMTLELSR